MTEVEKTLRLTNKPRHVVGGLWGVEIWCEYSLRWCDTGMRVIEEDFAEDICSDLRPEKEMYIPGFGNIRRPKRFFAVFHVPDSEHERGRLESLIRFRSSLDYTDVLPSTPEQTEIDRIEWEAWKLKQVYLRAGLKG